MESRSKLAEAALGAIVFAVVGLFVWLSLVVGGGAPADAVRYSLLFDSALGLTEDNAVAIAGVKIGVVDRIGIRGRQAEVVIAVEPDVELHADAIAAVRSKTLLGEKYIDLDPGAPPAAIVPAGGVIEKNTPTVEIDQLIRSAAQLVNSLNVITPPFEKAIASFDQLLRETDGDELAGSLASTVGDAGQLIRELSDLVASSKDDVQMILAMGADKGPTLFSKLERATDRIDQILAEMDPELLAQIMKKVDPAVDNADAAIKDLRVAMADVREASGRLDSILVRVDKTLARSEAINERTIREFLQVEGVRVNLIPDARVERRLRKLRNESTPLPVP